MRFSHHPKRWFHCQHTICSCGAQVLSETLMMNPKTKKTTCPKCRSENKSK